MKGVEVITDTYNHVTIVKYRGLQKTINMDKVYDKLIEEISMGLIAEHRSVQLEKILKEE